MKIKHAIEIPEFQLKVYLLKLLINFYCLIDRKLSNFLKKGYNSLRIEFADDFYKFPRIFQADIMKQNNLNHNYRV